MWQPGVYYTYIMASKSRATYVGMTNNLERRVNEHRLEGENGYCGRWKITRLVYFEKFSHPRDAIEREKQWKGWSREKKHMLVTEHNPGWLDLAPTDG